MYILYGYPQVDGGRKTWSDAGKGAKKGESKSFVWRNLRLLTKRQSYCKILNMTKIVCQQLLDMYKNNCNTILKRF